MEIEIISTAIIAGLIIYNLKISREHCTAIHHIENHLGLKDGRKVKWMEDLATLGVILSAIIVPISTIAMLKVHNANKN